MPSTPITGVRILRPGDDGYDAARATFNLALDQRPAAIALPRDADEVAAVVAVAAEHGLRVAPQRTGHNAGPLGLPGATILLQHRRAWTGSTIDAEGRRARVGAGARWEDVVPAASGPRARRAARLDAGRERRRLHARRRAGLATARRHGLAAEPRHRDRARHRRRRARAASTPTTTPTCSGRCAAAAATSASSPRSSSSCSRSPRSTRARCSSRGSAPPRCCTPGTAGPPTCPTRSPRSAGSCSSRRFPEIPEPLRGNQFVLVEARLPGRRGRRRRAAGPAARAGPADGHLRDDPAGRHRRAAHGPAATRSPTRGEHRLLGALPRRGDRRARRAGRARLGLADV